MKNSTLFKRILSAMLCVTLILSVMAGCGGNGGSDSSAGSDTEVSGTSAGGEENPLHIEGGEDVTLTYWIPISSTAAQNFESLAEHPYFKWAQEVSGVTVEFIHPSEEQMETQMNLMMASGEYYDMLFTPYYPGGPQVGIDEGCYVDLTPYLDEYMPDYKAALDCDDGSFSDWEWTEEERELYNVQAQPSFRKNCTTASGALYCVTQIWSDEYLPECGPVIRKDWLDEAGLDVPVTLDELEVVLEAFKNRGDGVIPMNLGSYGYSSYDAAIISAFDLYGWWQMNADSTEIMPHAYATDEYKEYLTLMNDWYSKGYIDPDFMNRDDDAVYSLFISDQLGVYFNCWSTPEMIKRDYTGDQEFDVVAMSLPRKTEDQQLHWRQGYGSEPTNNTVITTSCEHPEIAAQWLNLGFTQEGMLRANYGVEGEHYTMVDGKPYPTEEVINGDLEYFNSCVIYNGTTYCSLRGNWFRAAEDASTVLSPTTACQVVWSQGADRDYVWKYLTFEGDGWGQFEGAYNDAATYGDPIALKFIVGEESLDNYDEFKETCKSIGLDKAQQVAQAALDKQNGK